MTTSIVAVASLILGISSSQLAQLQPSDGTQECGPDGSVMRFDASSRSWTRTVEPCDPNPAHKGLPLDDRRGQPAEGDARCGSDGFVLRYSTAEHAWKETVSRCQ
jgi:hypothetical protein